MRMICFRLAAIALLALFGAANSASAQQVPVAPAAPAPVMQAPVMQAPVMHAPHMEGGACETCGQVAAPAKKGLFAGVFSRKSSSAAAPACGCKDVQPNGQCTTGCEPFQNEGCSTFHKEMRFLFGGCRSFFGCPQSPYGNAPRPVTTPCEYGTFHRW
ncbi:hypothetical protein [Tuwongella immobilis]|uniref:Uncharacterized protein n=1 Tax=Tuwongella immobilis TaxID=692036 RepID=A0A6C2YIF4_9BACT|nr:hypothetical protein [Tuwongella immobilis]VIP01310.1 unnamed protein product [Tuwongella immobilis]VTR98046.1 unnamed protein product [Tuwongella immobilis]